MQNKTQNAKVKSQNFLEEIVRLKKSDLISNTQKISLSDKQSNVSFLELFKNNRRKTVLIAEIKFASPTKPQLGSSKDLLKRAKEYENAGADAISVITEKHFFKGDVSFVSRVKEAVRIPVLQKDFVIDRMQILEAKQIGSDALLLIARLVDTKTLQRFVDLCFEMGIEPVVEIASDEDLAKAVATRTNIFAVNARNLETFAISVSSACSLIKKISGNSVKLGFSGIHSEKEIALYKAAGVDGVLIGTDLMQTNNILNFINNLQL